VLPRAFAPASVRTVSPAALLREPLSNANAAFGAETFASIAANDDWAARAWILGPPGAAASEAANPPAEVTGYRESTNDASFSARAPEGPSWIVLSLGQDGVWSASAPGGARLEISRANGPFLAVRVPAGTTAVRLRYRPPGWNAGLAIGAATAVLLGVAAVRRRRA